jgi:nitrate reductase assembly molybdenum cofactor insertion protein NarJ
MVTEPHLTEATAEDAAREYLYRFLAAVIGGPYAEGWDRALDPRSRELALFAAELLEECPESDTPSGNLGAAPREAPAFARLVRELAAPPSELRAEYDRVFGLVVPRECPPYETEYYPTSETFARSQQMADAAGFYWAFGVGPSSRSPERPDHLGLQLEFIALLLTKQRLAAADSGGGRAGGGLRSGTADFLPRPPRLVGAVVRRGPPSQGRARVLPRTGRRSDRLDPLRVSPAGDSGGPPARLAAVDRTPRVPARLRRLPLGALTAGPDSSQTSTWGPIGPRIGCPPSFPFDTPEG